MKIQTFAGATLWVLSAGLAACDEEMPSYELRNGGFEEPVLSAGAPQRACPDKWFCFSSTRDSEAGVTDRRRRTGAQAFYFRAQKEADAYHGLAQKIRVDPGDELEFSVYVINDPVEPLADEAGGTVSIEWQDETGKEIGRQWGESWGVSLSRMRWERFAVTAKAPERAACAVAVLTFFSRKSEGRGICYLDDAELVVRK